MAILTDQQIKEFQAIFKEEFGEEISEEEAIEKGSNFVDLVKIIYQSNNN